MPKVKRCPKCGAGLTISPLQYIGGHGDCRQIECSSETCDYAKLATWSESHEMLRQVESNKTMAQDDKEDQAMYRNLAHGW